VRQDFNEAEHCYRNAAEMGYHKAAGQGDAAAQFSLGLCCHMGYRVPEDRDEGLRWIRKAAEQGERNALDFLQHQQSQRQRKSQWLAGIVAVAVVTAIVAVLMFAWQARKVTLFADCNLEPDNAHPWVTFQPDREPRIRIGDAPTAEMIEEWNKGGLGYRYDKRPWDGNAEVETRLFQPGDPHAVYVFKDNRLVNIKLLFENKYLNDVIAEYTKRFGSPPHYTAHPTFTTKDGAIRQNDVVGWETDAGRWELRKFDLTQKGLWNDMSERGVMPAWMANGIGTLVEEAK
jgi:hypothetical protein